MTYVAEAGDYRVATSAEFAKTRDKIVAALARRVAEEFALCEARSEAVHQADEDCSLSGFSCDPRTKTVDLYNDRDGVIAKRLPKWITVQDSEPHIAIKVPPGQ
jgi:hypothetical protein